MGKYANAITPRKKPSPQRISLAIAQDPEGYAEKLRLEEEQAKENKILSDKRRKKAERATDKFMKCVEDSLKNKMGGIIPPEWQMSLQLLEQYYTQWLMVSFELQELDSFIVSNAMGTLLEHPLVSMQNKFSIRLEKMMSEMGLTMKSAKQLQVVEPKKAESSLDKFLKAQADN